MDESAGQAPFPIVVGCGRSGTTLMWRILDSHPQLAMVPERHFPVQPRKRWFNDDGSLNLTWSVDRITRSSWFPRFGLDPDSFRSIALAAAPTTYPDLIRCLNRAYAESQGKTRYGSKTPGHVLHIKELGQLFPEARFVHVIRDGRDVALSYLNQSFGPADLPAASRWWKERVEGGRRGGARVGPQRYCELRYEDLLENPEAELRCVCDFLELSYNSAMLRYHDKEPARELVRDPEHRLSKPLTKGLRDWRQQMSRPDVLLFESIAGSTLEEFGYERSARATLSEQTLVRARKASSRIQRGAARLRGRETAIVRRLRHA